MSNGQLKPPVNENDHIEGPEDAPVTLVEYGDYECPHCARAFPIVTEIRERMGDRLCFVYRNFPLREAHPHAEHAAEPGVQRAQFRRQRGARARSPSSAA